MVKDNFFLISTGCMAEFPDNSRSKFKNVFPKTATVNEIKNELYICLDQINFEQTFNDYDNTSTKKKGIHDVTFYNEETRETTHYDFEYKIFTIESMVKHINDFVLRSPVEFLKIKKDPSNPNRLRMKVIEHGVIFSMKLWKFLQFPIPQFYSNPDEMTTRQMDEYVSMKNVELVENVPYFISVKCEDVDAYSKNGSYSKIIAKVPLTSRVMGATCHYDSPLYQYFRLASNKINTVNIELLHPNGQQLYLSKGPATIVKANIKEMNPINDFFYVQISSEPTESYPENTNNNFKVTLPFEYDLSGEWQVAITNLFLPANKNNFFAYDQSVYHHAAPQDRTIMFVKHRARNPEFVEQYPGLKIAGKPIADDSPLKGHFKGVDDPIVYTYPYEKFTREEFIKDFNYYHDESIHIEVDTDENFIFYARYQFEDEIAYEMKVHFFMTDRLYNVLVKDPEASNIGVSDLAEYNYLPVVTQHAIDAFKREGHSVKMQQGLFNAHRKTAKEEIKKDLFALFNLSEYYEEEYYYTEEEVSDEKESKKKKQMSRKKVAKLIEKIIQKEKIEENIYDLREANPSWMFIYTDIVTPTIMAGSFNNLLKLVPYKNNGGRPSGGFYNFPSLDFFPVNRTNLRTIEFLIKTQSGKEYKYYSEGIVNMTLLFKKIKSAL